MRGQRPLRARLSDIFVFFFVDFLVFLTETSRTASIFFNDFMYFFMFLGISSNVLGSFSRGLGALGQLLCTGAWVLSVFASTKSRLVSLSVHRRVGFKDFNALGLDFCAQARGF